MDFTIIKFIVILSLTPVGSLGEYRQRLSGGAVFQKLPLKYVQKTGDWVNSFILNIPPITAYMRGPISPLNGGDPLTTLHTALPNAKANEILFSMLEDFQKQYNELLRQINDTIPEYKPNLRTKRAILDISNVLDSLFGTTGTNKFNSLKAAVETINKKQNLLHQETRISLQKLTSISKIQHDNLQSIAKNLREFTLTFERDRVHQMKLYQNLTTDVVDNVTPFLLKYQNVLTRISLEMAQYKSNINSLLNGKIHPAIINPQTVKKLFTDIQNHLISTGSNFRIDTSLYAFYNHAHFIISRSGYALIVTVSIPVLYKHQMNFELYRLIKTNMRMSHKDSNSSSNTQLLLPQVDFIAINSHSQEYITLNKDDLIQCSKEATYMICNQLKPIKPFVQQSCELALFLNHKSYLNLCTYEWHLQPIAPQIDFLDHSSILLQNTQQITINCNNNIRKIPDCVNNTCLISVKFCECLIQNANGGIHPHFEPCSDQKNITSSLWFPRNLKLLNELFAQGNNQIPPSFISQIPEKLQLPQLRIIRANLDKVLSTEKPVTFSLKNLKNHLITGNPVFTNPTAELQWRFDNTFSVKYQIWKYVQMAISILLIIIAGYQGYRIYRLALIVSVLTARTKAFTINPDDFDFSDLTTSSFDWSDVAYHHINNNSQHSMVILMIIILIAYLIKKCKHKCKFSRLNFTKSNMIKSNLYIIISDGKFSVQVLWQQIPLLSSAISVPLYMKNFKTNFQTIIPFFSIQG